MPLFSTTAQAPNDRTASQAPARPVHALLHLDTAVYILAGITFVSLALRLYSVNTYSFWGDEISSLDSAGLGFPAIFTGRFGYISNQTGFHYALLWLLMHIVDPASNSAFVRLPSTLGGALTPLVVYGIGRETFGRLQGGIAALMLALSTVLLNYSQDLRPYALLCFFTVLSVFCLLRADNSGSRIWWAAFVAASISNALNSYMSVTLVLPALLPYFGWVLYKAWKARYLYPDRFRSAALSTAVLTVSLLLVVADILQTSRPSPNLARYSIPSASTYIVDYLSSFTHFGIDSSIQQPLELLYLLLALFGIYFAVRGTTARPYAASLVVLFVVVPPVLLSILATSNMVFQRYILFCLPFYFLLIAHALVSLCGRVPGYRQQATVTLALYGLAFLPFAVGAFNYLTPEGHLTLSYRPDFRGVAAYLTAHSRPQDIVIFIDDPPLGYTITNYYWHGKPPVPAYDARDPRLFGYKGNGDIYWVVSAGRTDVVRSLTWAGQGLTPVVQLDLVSVLREPRPVGGIAGAMDRMVGRWEGLGHEYQSVLVLRGSVYRGRGDVERAVEFYRKAGTYFPLGAEYLKTSNGYERLGDDQKAWREALISFSWEPQRPEVHTWLARKLSAEGQPDLGVIETRIAASLQQVVGK